MVADVTMRRWTGPVGSPTKTDVTQVNNRHRTDDVVATTGVGNAIPVPPTGEMRYGFWQSYRLRVDGGTFTTVNNVLAWPDGVDDTPAGVALVVARATDYAEATGTVGVTGLELTQANHPYLLEQPVDLFSYSSGNPIDLEGSASSAPSDVGYFIVVQCQVDPLASSSVSPQETITYGWDEV